MVPAALSLAGTIPGILLLKAGVPGAATPSPWTAPSKSRRTSLSPSSVVSSAGSSPTAGSSTITGSSATAGSLPPPVVESSCSVLVSEGVSSGCGSTISSLDRSSSSSVSSPSKALSTGSNARASMTVSSSPGRDRPPGSRATTSTALALVSMKGSVPARSAWSSCPSGASSVSTSTQEDQVSVSRYRK